MWGARIVETCFVCCCFSFGCRGLVISVSHLDMDSSVAGTASDSSLQANRFLSRCFDSTFCHSQARTVLMPLKVEDVHGSDLWGTSLYFWVLWPLLLKRCFASSEPAHFGSSNIIIFHPIPWLQRYAIIAPPATEAFIANSIAVSAEAFALCSATLSSRWSKHLSGHSLLSMQTSVLNMFPHSASGSDWCMRILLFCSCRWDFHSIIWWACCLGMECGTCWLIGPSDAAMSCSYFSDLDCWPATQYNFQELLLIYWCFGPPSISLIHCLIYSIFLNQPNQLSSAGPSCNVFSWWLELHHLEPLPTFKNSIDLSVIFQSISAPKIYW